MPALALLAGLPLAGLGVTAASLPFADVASATTGCTGTLSGIQVTAGSPQLAKVGTAFADPLEATVVDTGGCPVPFADVVFTTPGTGPSASFAGGLGADTVTTNSQGIATAPALTANDISGSYSVTAEIQNTTFAVTFDLTNTTTGVATTVTAVSGNSQSAEVGAQYTAPLEVSVTDAYGAAVPGTTVDFTVVTTSGAGATFVGGGASAAVQTGTERDRHEPASRCRLNRRDVHGDSDRKRGERAGHLHALRRCFGTYHPYRRDGFFPEHRAGHHIRDTPRRDCDRHQRQ